MDGLKLETPGKIKVVFEGKDYLLSKPTLGASRDFAKAIKLAESDDSAKIDAMIEYLAKLGLPREICENLMIEEVEKIIDALTPKKKS